MADNEYEIAGVVGTQAVPSAAPVTDPFDIFPGVDADQYPELTGRQSLPPGNYLLRITDFGFDGDKKTTLIMGLQVVRALTVAEGAEKPVGGSIRERFNNFWPPAPDAAENIVKAHRISVGRLKGVFHITTGKEIQGRLGSAELKQIRTDILGKEVVAGVAWTKRMPKGSKERAPRMTYSEWLTQGKPEVFDNITSFRALREEERT